MAIQTPKFYLKLAWIKYMYMDLLSSILSFFIPRAYLPLRLSSNKNTWISGKKKSHVHLRIWYQFKVNNSLKFTWNIFKANFRWNPYGNPENNWPRQQISLPASGEFVFSGQILYLNKTFSSMEEVNVYKVGIGIMYKIAYIIITTTFD